MKIKNSFLDKATLGYYEFGAETEVIVDASPVGLGAMLTQKKRDGHILVTYIQPDGTRSIGYSLAVRASTCVLGWGTVPGRDRSKDFGSIFSNSNSKPPVRIERWSTYVQEFNITVDYIPGKDNPADYVSRHPVHAPENTTDYKEQKQTEEFVHSIVRRNVPESLSVEEFRTATVNDPVLLEVMDILQTGTRVSRHKVEDLGPHKLVRSELAVANGILLR